MKKLRPYLGPSLVLVVILAFSLWTCVHMTQETNRWRAQINQSDALAQAQRWDDALVALNTCYESWSTRQTFLRIVFEHRTVDDAEGMFRRAMAFAAIQELSEFRAELADLSDQLRALAEMERFHIKNIL